MKTSLSFRRWFRRIFPLALVLATTAGLPAQTPPPAAKRLPPAGIAISDTDRAELTAGVLVLRKEIDAAAREIAGNETLTALLPDLEVFHKAVDWALRYDEFFDPSQVAFARRLLVAGRERAKQLGARKSPWLESTGLIIRGYRSRLDGSFQPYALVVPTKWRPKESTLRRLDVVLAGRNEKRTELAFMAEHEKSPGEIVPENGIVLHPYGRFCNATKFAGEADVFEAMASVQTNYHIDPNKIIVRGFSMGGASVWHLATHHAGVWAAASPGAGFAETAAYAKVRAPGKEPPTWWEEKLWNWYDATSYAGNLFNCPTIAYSGEIDPQKQSADIMETAMTAEGLTLERLIGPQTAHKYHPDSKKELSSRLDMLALKGREPVATEVHLTTYTLQYPRNSWVTIMAMEKHWERADVRARLEVKNAMTVTTRNVTGLRLYPRDAWQGTITIDGQKVSARAEAQVAGIWLVRENDRWNIGSLMSTKHKVTGVTGPIDDAFMDAFLFVRPTGKPLNEKVGRWTTSEMAHATKLWRDIFRGDAPVKDDSAVTADDVTNKNLVLWGDPASNEILAQILARLPLTWNEKELVFNGHTYASAHHAPVMIFPNPLNPQHYIVLNSGMDFRDDAYGTNALQTPKLPDYAILDLDTPPGPKWPGKIVEAGFFDEEWKAPAKATR